MAALQVVGTFEREVDADQRWSIRSGWESLGRRDQRCETWPDQS